MLGENDQLSYKLSGSISNKKSLGVGLGIGYQFIKNEKEDTLDKIHKLENENREIKEKNIELEKKLEKIMKILNID